MNFAEYLKTIKNQGFYFSQVQVPDGPVRHLVDFNFEPHGIEKGEDTGFVNAQISNQERLLIIKLLSEKLVNEKAYLI